VRYLAACRQSLAQRSPFDNRAEGPSLVQFTPASLDDTATTATATSTAHTLAEGDRCARLTFADLVDKGDAGHTEVFPGVRVARTGRWRIEAPTECELIHP
jgi:hypothetical protein